MFLQPIFDLGPLANTTHVAPYPEANKQIPIVAGYRSSMKGAAFAPPIRNGFVTNVLDKFNVFMNAQPDAAPSMIAWEFFDPTATVVASEKGCFANRGQLVWKMNLEFMKELEADDEWASDDIGGGASIKGKKGAVLLYGNYDDIFGGHHAQSQKIKAKYDPSNMFNKLFPTQTLDATVRCEVCQAQGVIIAPLLNITLPSLGDDYYLASLSTKKHIDECVRVRSVDAAW
ncbi:hypothetical protein LTR56_026631 [Elasticomyces elasticus]|nr:hypothetical protein LTR22_027577 [Elasticomyces elasticus]KAK3615370.1 hypothetical protein LTR56_026631 [Elasticomyces elasticus]